MIKVEIKDKFTLSIKEASAYFGIGEHKLRRIADENPDAPWLLKNGTHSQIKRVLFEEYVNRLEVI